jgi:cell division transport system permease protein
MYIRKPPYFIKKALSNMRQSLLVNFVTISTISIAILIFSTFIMILYNLNNLVSKFEDEVHIVSYLKDEHAAAYENIRKDVLNIKGVDMVSYRSKEEALQSFKNSLGKDDRFLDDIPENPLPASFEIRLKKGFKNKARIKHIDASLKAMGVFDDTVYGREWIENFHNLLNMLKIIGTAVAGGFLLAAVFIISNTIKLTVYARKEEIEILKLVGATNTFIKIPFFIEGIIQGFLGAAISTFLLYVLYNIFLAKVQTLNFMGINPQDMPFLPAKFLVLVIIFSTILGLFGSFLSLGEIIKE